MLRSLLRRASSTAPRPRRPYSSALGTLRSPPPTRIGPAKLILPAQRAYSSAVPSSAQIANPGRPSSSSQSFLIHPSRHPRTLDAQSSLRHVASARLRPSIGPFAHGYVRAFHATSRNQISPLPFIAGLLKSSTALEFARMAARIGLTFIPIILLKNVRTKKFLEHAEKYGHPDLVNKKEDMLKRMRQRTILFHILIFIPLFLYWATIIASLERTPLTGRWRIILLSPEEEDSIAAQLAGAGWYRAVGEILSAEGAPEILPPSDWRLVWVRDTLRRLESAIPTLQQEEELCPHWIDCGPDDIPLPPPADYPLRPRPRGSEVLRRFAELSCARTCPPSPHAIAGPPYSLLVVDRPDSSNAFSYGFGPDGGGGIVVFSGFLDEVLSRHTGPLLPPPPPPSFLSRLFGLAPPPRHPVPTEQQTAELATLLAHELAHLVLSHHIETLSSGSIVWPSVLSIVTDALRALLFPVTMLFGPFINDAIAGMWKAGAGEFSQLQEYCTSQKQEVEADVVSARLLAHAGFDPRDAVRFWEGRRDTPQNAECSPARASEPRPSPDSATAMARRMLGETHPVHELRVEKLKAELERWETLRRAARAERDRAQAQARAHALAQPPVEAQTHADADA